MIRDIVKPDEYKQHDWDTLDMHQRRWVIWNWGWYRGAYLDAVAVGADPVRPPTGGLVSPGGMVSPEPQVVEVDALERERYGLDAAAPSVLATIEEETTQWGDPIVAESPSKEGAYVLLDPDAQPAVVVIAAADTPAAGEGVTQVFGGPQEAQTPLPAERVLASWARDVSPRREAAPWVSVGDSGFRRMERGRDIDYLVAFVERNALHTWSWCAFAGTGTSVETGVAATVELARRAADSVLIKADWVLYDDHGAATAATAQGGQDAPLEIDDITEPPDVLPRGAMLEGGESPPEDSRMWALRWCPVEIDGRVESIGRFMNADWTRLAARVCHVDGMFTWAAAAGMNNDGVFELMGTADSVTAALNAADAALDAAGWRLETGSLTAEDLARLAHIEVPGRHTRVTGLADVDWATIPLTDGGAPFGHPTAELDVRHRLAQVAAATLVVLDRVGDDYAVGIARVYEAGLLKIATTGDVSVALWKLVPAEGTTLREDPVQAVLVENARGGRGVTTVEDPPRVAATYPPPADARRPCLCPWAENESGDWVRIAEDGRLCGDVDESSWQAVVTTGVCRDVDDGKVQADACLRAQGFTLQPGDSWAEADVVSWAEADVVLKAPNAPEKTTTQMPTALMWSVMLDGDDAIVGLKRDVRGQDPRDGVAATVRVADNGAIAWYAGYPGSKRARFERAGSAGSTTAAAIEAVDAELLSMGWNVEFDDGGVQLEYAKTCIDTLAADYRDQSAKDVEELNDAIVRYRQRMVTVCLRDGRRVALPVRDDDGRCVLAWADTAGVYVNVVVRGEALAAVRALGAGDVTHDDGQLGPVGVVVVTDTYEEIAAAMGGVPA